MSLAACLEVVFRRIGGMVASLAREGGRLTASFSRTTTFEAGFERAGGRLTGTATRVPGMTCSFGLICRTEIGDDYCLWASDQMVLTVDGGKIYVTQG